ncbi:hypothetical protein B0H10DRAFT_1802232 [Mycena sp. CBHHK59/15]|nr:hypothetical protein B0H10DRAFT_1802232 [Mycena sp. CBHHK59/15]
MGRCTQNFLSPLWLPLFIVSLPAFVGATPTNQTIDDVHGDSVTGAQVQYLPQVPASEGPLWFNQTSCSKCVDVPDARSSFDNTWTSALYLADIGSMSVSVKFSGTALYVFFILPNFSADSGLASSVRCIFFIDGALVGSFAHDSDGSSVFKYDVLAYKNATIMNGDHVLLIETTGADPALIIFDYAVYTYVSILLVDL